MLPVLEKKKKRKKKDSKTTELVQQLIQSLGAHVEYDKKVPIPQAPQAIISHVPNNGSMFLHSDRSGKTRAPEVKVP